MKKIVAIFMIMAVALTGCMMEKQDYSDLITYNALVPVESESTATSDDNIVPDNGQAADDESDVYFREGVYTVSDPASSQGSSVNEARQDNDDKNAGNDKNTGGDVNAGGNTVSDDGAVIGSAETNDLSNGIAGNDQSGNSGNGDNNIVNDGNEAGNNSNIGNSDNTANNDNVDNTVEEAKLAIENEAVGGYENSADNVNTKKKEDQADTDDNDKKDSNSDNQGSDNKKDSAGKNDSTDKKDKTEDKDNSKEKDNSKDNAKNKSKDKPFDIDKLVVDFDNFAELAPTTTMDFEELVGDNGIYKLPEGFPEPGTYRIVVDLYHQLVMAFTKDENGDYTVPVRFMLCSSGANATQSPTGTFKMRNYRVRFALFNNTTSYAQYWSLITGRIYFHSILYSAKDASKYTESYKRLGTNVSHGCIRLTVPDARWIWFNCAPETVVEIRRGSKSEKLLGKIRDKMTLASYPSSRLKLKAGKIPMTDNWTIEDVPHDVGFENGSQ
ncbi:MAG: L,D-transpeptidase family protein [Lachnospiraceae bacterium]|nr:L,D-transpeptidase family protein [Lachnospiraceae bacterium]